MKTLLVHFRAVTVVLIMLCAGCGTTGNNTSNKSTATGSAPGMASKYKAGDGRTVDIGRASVSSGGLQFKNPHLEKCWVASGVNFADYDTLYIAPTLSTAKHAKDEEILHEAAKQNLVKHLVQMLNEKRVFANVVTSEAEIKPGARTLRLENTITEYAKGGGAARYFVGLYGGGQPVLRVQGKMADANKTVFSYEARRSGVSAGARLTGVFMKDEDIQNEDIHSLSLDLTDFLAAMAGKYQAKN